MKTKIAILLLTGCFSTVFGQVKEKEIFLKDSKGIPQLVKLSETKVSDNIASIRDLISKQYKTNSDNQFLRKESPKIENNFQNEKLQQYYKGIKVEFGQLNVVSKDRNLKSINGNIIPISNLDINPTLSEEQALQFALNHISANEYAWQNPDKEGIIKGLKKSQNATYFPHGELVIIEKDRYSDSPIPTLAYKFDIYALRPMSRKNYYVNAENGKIILEDAIIKHIRGTAYTIYSGQRAIETQQSGSSFRLRDYSRGNGVETYNLNTGSSYTTAADFTDNDNIWTTAEFHNSNKDATALDAHWGAMMTYDYFSQTHSRNSIDNNGYQLKNYVNTDLTGFGFENSDNAFWDGNVMTYGMGTSLGSLVSLDIIAHEIGHGLDEHTSDLIYERESGAIDEGLSDIWGSMVEFFAAPGKQTYNVGECDNFIFDGTTISMPPDCGGSPSPETLASGSSVPAISKVFVYDTLGRLINIYPGNDDINLGKLNSGAYIVKVQLSSGKIITKKIEK
ncbi:MAG: M4 family metallopeptidase [Draconibacterium sp.]